VLLLIMVSTLSFILEEYNSLPMSQTTKGAIMMLETSYEVIANGDCSQ